MSKELEEKFKQIADMEKAVKEISARMISAGEMPDQPKGGFNIDKPSISKTVDDCIQELETALAVLKRLRGY